MNGKEEETEREGEGGGGESAGKDALDAAKKQSVRLALVYLMLAIVFFFNPALSLADIAYMLCLFASHKLILRHIAFAPLLILLLAICFAMSVFPVLFSSWVLLGTANANFLFFIGLFLCVFLALGIIEFARAMVVESSMTSENEQE